ncbi:MAG: hypothetical protein J7K81_07865 [Methanophagales archaeon]|nr:hypothetical protein [Methanophagales archaeon]
MELRYEHGGIIIENKVFTALDKFVADFTKVLEEYIDYVVVSGYVVILFGRARGTEDIDTIIGYMNKDTFTSFYQKLSREGYYFLNPEDVNGLYEMLEEGLRIRIAMELKFDKEGNRKERREFIHYYAEWVKRVPNEVWSKQQAELIDSFMANATNFKMTPEKYLEMVKDGSTMR